MEASNELSEWIRNYGVQLVRIASMYSSDQSAAEDCVQDAFIKAYKSIHQLSQRENPFPWLMRIVINECKTRHRRGWREILTSKLPEEMVIGAEDTYLVQAEFRQVRKAIQSIPDKYRIPIILHYFEGFPVSEIAAVMRISPNTVKTRLLRARRRLGQILQEGEEWDRELGRQVIES